MNAAPYLFRTFAFALLFGGLVFLFNWFIDPFGYFGRIPFGPHHDYEARLFKARAVANDAYDAVILGSSRADIIPTESTAKWGLKTFNAAFLGAYPEEMAYFAEHFLPDVGTVIVGFDDYMFNAACHGPQPAFAVTSWPETARHGISYHATKHSFLTLKKHLQGRAPLYAPAGSRNMDRQEAETRAATATDYARIMAYYETGFSCDYRMSEERLRIAKDMVRRLQRPNRNIVLFLQPIHPALHERIVAHGHAATFDLWRQRMKEAFPDVFDLTQAPFSSPEFFYWNDPVHYTRATSERIVDLLFGRPATGGGSVTPP